MTKLAASTCTSIFIDFRKAFDSIHRESMWKVMKFYGIPDKLITLTRAFYTGYACKMQGGAEDDYFEVKSGVRQGCVISPLLFIMATDFIMKQVQATHRTGLRWNLTTKLNYLAYADDVALFSTTHGGMQTVTDKLITTASKAGLHINEQKTKVLRIHRDGMGPASNNNFTVSNKSLEFVDNFLYLGAKIDASGGAAADVKNRINSATTAFYRLNKVWRSRSMSNHLKFKLYNSNVVSVLLYGCETWRMTKVDMDKLEVFHMNCCRRILKIYWWSKTSNLEVCERSKQKPVSQHIEVRRWRYLGHSLRRKESLPHTSLGWAPEGTRRRGRPNQTWRRTALKQMKVHNIKSWAEASEMARDRERWKGKEKAILAQYSTRSSAT